MTGHVCNFAQLAGQVRLDNKTAGKYLAVFEQIFLLRRVAPWSTYRLARVVKTPRITSSTPACFAACWDCPKHRLAQERGPFGPALESYVYGEMLRRRKP
jgi:hypothetical protein